MKKLAFALFTVTVCLLLVSQIRADIPLDWIHGTVTSEPVSVTYGITVYSFSFQADQSSFNGQVDTSSTNLTCLWLSQPVNGNTYNFSGVLISDNSTGMPLGAFLVSSVNQPGSNQTSNPGNVSDWTWTFRQIWNALSTVGKLLSTLVMQIVLATTGYSLTPFLASLLVLVLMGAFFMFLGKHLPWYIDLLGFHRVHCCWKQPVFCFVG
jgi:hypothetical protein